MQAEETFPLAQKSHKSPPPQAANLKALMWRSYNRSSSTRAEHGRSLEERRAATADQDSRAQACKKVQAIKAAWALPGGMGLLRDTRAWVPGHGHEPPVFLIPTWEHSL
eukprot:scaffold27020_cov16-Tisochrysis_lutea.AAC.1